MPEIQKINSLLTDIAKADKELIQYTFNPILDLHDYFNFDNDFYLSKKQYITTHLKLLYDVLRNDFINNQSSDNRFYSSLIKSSIRLEDIAVYLHKLAIRLKDIKIDSYLKIAMMPIAADIIERFDLLSKSIQQSSFSSFKKLKRLQRESQKQEMDYYKNLFMLMEIDLYTKDMIHKMVSVANLLIKISDSLIKFTEEVRVYLTKRDCLIAES